MPTIPQITDFSPAVGAQITADTILTFDVSNVDSVFRRIIIHALLPQSGIMEIVYDSDGWGTYYGTSSKVEITDRHFRFGIRRTGGWISPPTLKIFAISTLGEENA